MQPQSFSTLATNTALKDLELFYTSVRRFYPDTDIFLVCDSAVVEWAQEKNDSNLHCDPVLEKYAGQNRKQMESAGTWTSFMLEKCTAIDNALEVHDNTLFLDCDQCVLSHIHIEPCELGLSQHFIKPENENRYGKYNGGFVFVASKKFTKWWRQNTPGSKYMEQGVLEQAPQHFETYEFPIQYNFGWWRLYECDEIAKRESLFDYDLRLTYDGKPVVTLHTHFFDNSFPITAKFNKFILDLLPDHDALKSMIQSIKIDTGLVLMCTFYNPKDAARRQEIDFCLQQNLQNSSVKKVVLFLDNDQVQYPKNSKIQPVVRDKEITYGEIFQYAQDNYSNQYCMLINNDIFLDPISFQDLDDLCAMLDNDHVLSLSRHEFDPDQKTSSIDKNFLGILLCHTQDAWVWKANFVPENADFPCGVLGCDNAINHRIVQSGKRPLNWATRYKIHHYDVARGKTSKNFLSENFRNTNRELYPEEQGYYLTPEFSMVQDTSLDDLLKQLNFNSSDKYQIICEMFSRKIAIRNR